MELGIKEQRDFQHFTLSPKLKKNNPGQRIKTNLIRVF